ncbi:MAG TPA: hypothetical protein VGF81_13425 [Solirubrobacteraceae bacterium]
MASKASAPLRPGKLPDAVPVPPASATTNAEAASNLIVLALGAIFVGWTILATGANHTKGQVAGGLLLGGLKPVLWTGGSAIELNTLGQDSAALAINQVGEVAGWVDTAGGPTHAAMWAG